MRLANKFLNIKVIDILIYYVKYKLVKYYNYFNKYFIMINNVFNLTSKILKHIVIDQAERNFIKHNKSLFGKSQNKDYQILVELNYMQTNHIAISHFSKVLSEIHNAELVGYEPRIKFSILEKLKSHITSFKSKMIFKSFGINKFLDTNVSDYKTLAYKLTNKIMTEINSKTDLVDLTVDGILVGDLIYDQYLKSFKVPTVNINSEEFRKILYEFSILYYRWKDLFLKRNIKAIVISHACYFMGLPARIGIAFGISAYQANIQCIYFLSKKNLFPSCEFHTYKDDFKKLDSLTQDNGIKKARERIKLIFEGSTEVDQTYIKESAYNQKKTTLRILGNKRPIKILIAPHSFYDSPNGLGRNLFPDFYEWLEFLGELSNKTDYEWYIKTHPTTDILDKKTINDFVSRYKKIILIPDTTSHHQLIEEGINIVLTVYGSIGIEYAAKNITVINASLNNPHISYNFNIYPKSKEELKDLIFNLTKHVNADLFSDDIYKCYFMKYLFYDHNIFFSNFKSAERQIGGYECLFSSKIYDHWINYFTPTIQNKIELNLKKFILSGEYKLKSPSWN